MASIAVNLINLLLAQKPVNADVIVLDTETTNNQHIGQKIILDIAWMFVNIQHSDTATTLTSGLNGGLRNYLVAETLQSQFYREYFASVHGQKLLDYSGSGSKEQMFKDLNINMGESKYGFQFSGAQSERTEAAKMEGARIALFNEARESLAQIKSNRSARDYNIAWQCVLDRYNELYTFRTQKSNPANSIGELQDRIRELMPDSSGYTDQQTQLIRFTKRSTALIDAYMQNFGLQDQPVISAQELSILQGKMNILPFPWKGILTILLDDINKSGQKLYGITGHNIGHDFEAIKQTSAAFGGVTGDKILTTIQSVCLRAIGNFFKSQTPEKIMSLLGREVGSKFFEQVSVGLKQKGNLTFEVLHDVFIKNTEKYKEKHRAGQDTLDEAKVFLTIVEKILLESGVKAENIKVI